MSGLDRSCASPQDSSSKICTPFSSSGPVQRDKTRKNCTSSIFQFSISEVNHNNKKGQKVAIYIEARQTTYIHPELTRMLFKTALVLSVNNKYKVFSL